MSASKIRGKILWTLWATGKPMTIPAIAEKTALNASETIEFLQELLKARYVSMTGEQSYAITDLGKKALGFPEVDKQLAQKILSTVPPEKAFYFYYELDQYSGVHADNLNDFANKIPNLDTKCLDFHLSRGDFEKWIHSLGDVELSRKLELLRLKRLSGENLRKTLQETVNSRIAQLTRIAS